MRRKALKSGSGRACWKSGVFDTKLAGLLLYGQARFGGGRLQKYRQIHLRQLGGRLPYITSRSAAAAEGAIPSPTVTGLLL